MVETIDPTQQAHQSENLGPPREYDATMRQTFPMRNTYAFANGVRISSDFEAGNLGGCVEISPEAVNDVDPASDEEENADDGNDGKQQVQSQASLIAEEGGTQSDPETKYSITDTQTLFSPTEDEIFCFDLWVCPDSLPYIESKSRAQFYFDVTGMPPQSRVETRRTLRFRVVNQSNQAKLLSYGHKPVFLILSHAEYIQLKAGQVPVHSQKWQRIPSNISYRRAKEGLCVAFEFTLGPEFKQNDHILFAYSQPFTRTDIERSMIEFEQQCEEHGDQIYFHKQVLIDSLEGHPMHMLTVTGNSGHSETDTGPDEIHDDPTQVLYARSGDRPLSFDKPTIFISSRVHCGETIASFFLQGMFDFMGAYGPQARVLLDKFVFKIIPLLNPDGVERGYWRNDTQGLNLNRVYSDPDPVRHPTIYACKAAILHEHKKQRLYVYVDLHGHATKRGCFVFGNTIQSSKKSQVQQILLPKLMSLNSVNFDLRECNFDDASNNKKDRKGDSRASSGRATIFRETGNGGVVYCFTLEGNYATGLRINTLQPRFDIEKEKRVLKEDNPVQDTSSAFYKIRKVPVYGSEVFRDVGQAFLISLLDLQGINPLTRLVSGPAQDVQDTLKKLRQDLTREYFKPTIKSLKKGKKTKRSKHAEGPSFELVLGESDKQRMQQESASAARD